MNIIYMIKVQDRAAGFQRLFLSNNLFIAGRDSPCFDGSVEGSLFFSQDGQKMQQAIVITDERVRDSFSCSIFSKGG